MTIRNRKPGPVARGDKILVVAPASSPEASSLEAGIDVLKAQGYVVDNLVLASQQGYLAGDDDTRTALLNGALRRADATAIFCARGGFGTTRILRRIDFAALQAHPKIIVGYSDITALHLGALSIAGLPGLSASMIAIDWPSISQEEIDTIRAMLEGTAARGVYATTGIELQPVATGQTIGRLIGGNLTVLCRLIGTPYLPDLSGAILFLEEVGEAPYRIDGLLSQLLHSGILESVNGLVFGAFTEAEVPSDKPSLALEDVLHHYATYCNGPVATGLPYGHISDKVPMPIGVEAELEVQANSALLRANEQLTVA